MITYLPDVTDFGNEIAGSNVIDLASHFNPHQPRDAHGKFTKSGMAAEPDDAARQAATKRALLAASQKRILDALNTPVEKMSDEDIARAARVITHLMSTGGLDKMASDLSKSKIVPQHIADHVTNRLGDLSKNLQTETNHDARKTLITHLALIIGAVGLSLVTGGLGIPIGVAALIAVSPQLAQEWADYKTARKLEPTSVNPS